METKLRVLATLILAGWIVTALCEYWQSPKAVLASAMIAMMSASLLRALAEALHDLELQRKSARLDQVISDAEEIIEREKKHGISNGDSRDSLRSTRLSCSTSVPCGLCAPRA